MCVRMYSTDSSTSSGAGETLVRRRSLTGEPRSCLDDSSLPEILQALQIQLAAHRSRKYSIRTSRLGSTGPRLSIRAICPWRELTRGRGLRGLAIPTTSARVCLLPLSCLHRPISELLCNRGAVHPANCAFDSQTTPNPFSRHCPPVPCQSSSSGLHTPSS